MEQMRETLQDVFARSIFGNQMQVAQLTKVMDQKWLARHASVGDAEMKQRIR
jgi:hypothetical protein